MSVLLLSYFACVVSAPLPDVGPCADYPEGVYEYGQIGIGTCLAGPAALQFLDDGHVLAVSNANPFLDFTGGSLLTLDLDKLDEGSGRNLVTDLDPHAVPLPSFNGAMAYAAPYETLLVTNRNSEGFRTREAMDNVWFVDVNNPRSPSLNTELGTVEDGAALPVGYDPNEVVYDDTTDRAWTVNRTSHTVSTIDMASRPTRLVPPGGDGRLEADPFVDVDASGSHASFARLTALDSPLTTIPNHWDVRWSAASVRLWTANDLGLYRTTGNGEGTWVRSGIDYDVDLSELTDVTTVRDPAWYWTDGDDGDYGVTQKLIFVDQGSIRTAKDAGDGEHWGLYPELLAPEEDEVALADPFLVRDDAGVNHLYYAAGSGHTWIGRATSPTGSDFKRKDAVLTDDTHALSDPSVLWDQEIGRWRMWYSATDDAGTVELRTAWSDDLASWTPEDAVTVGLPAPTVTYWAGRYHCIHLSADGLGFADATSPDGYTWTDVGVLLTAELRSHPEDGAAVQSINESAFKLTDLSGEGFDYAVPPGAGYYRSDEGWSLLIAAGQVAGPEDVTVAEATALRVTSRVGDDVWADLGDVGIGQGTLIDGALSIASVALEPSTEKGAFDAESVHDAVVVPGAAGWVMFYAGSDGAVTSIGRATSADGVTWAREAEPVYVGAADWEAVAVVPGSLEVLDDGTWQLWYAGSADGESWNIGVLSSTDEGVTFAPVPGASYAWQFDPETPGTWDDSGVKDPYVVLDGDTERMWYSGFDGDVWQLGYAERKVGTLKWSTSEDAEGAPRPVLEVATGALGVEGLERPVVTAGTAGWSILYAGTDASVARVGLANAREADRLHRELYYPTLADTWGFTVVPPDDGDAIDLDAATIAYAPYFSGAGTLALDADAGLLYVGSTLWPEVVALDVRDDSTSTWTDLNYLGAEAVLLVQTSTGIDSGVRDMVVNQDGTIYGLMDEPESVLVIKADDVEDDAVSDEMRDRVRGLLPLPRSFERDEGVNTQGAVGPGQLVMHPDGKHLFVTNFNNNSVSVYDVTLGPLGLLVGEVQGVGENPYSLAISPDGTRLVVANYEGEVEGNVQSTLVVVDADPASDTFLQPLTWVVNQ